MHHTAFMKLIYIQMTYLTQFAMPCIAKCTETVDRSIKARQILNYLFSTNKKCIQM